MAAHPTSLIIDFARLLPEVRLPVQGINTCLEGRECLSPGRAVRVLGRDRTWGQALSILSPWRARAHTQHVHTTTGLFTRASTRNLSHAGTGMRTGRTLSLVLIPTLLSSVHHSYWTVYRHQTYYNNTSSKSLFIDSNYTASTRVHFRQHESFRPEDRLANWVGLIRVKIDW